MRTVADGIDRHPRRHPTRKVGQKALNAIHHLDHIGIGLLEDDHDDGRPAVKHPRLPPVAHAQLDIGDGGQPHDCAILRPQNEVAIILRPFDPVIDRNGAALDRALDQPGRLRDIGGVDGGADALHRNPGRGGGGGVHLHPHRGLFGAGHDHLRHTLHAGHAGRDDAVHRIIDGAGRQGVGGDGEDEHRRIGRVGAAEIRRVG